jgi:DNA ligase-associated metallophosphoesterase
MTQSLTINEQHFTLHPAGGLYWNEANLLMISDIHLGKVSHFRKYGTAVPRQAIAENFSLLSHTLDFFRPAKLFFLGDLFHSYLNAEWQLFEKWVAKTGIPMMLIAGNHDIICPSKYEGLGIPMVSELEIDQFLLTHHPCERHGYFNFSGHVHPAIRLRGKGRQSLRLPCFFKRHSQLILPAFGSFTGTHILDKKKGDEVYAIADGQVIKI